MGRSRKKTTSTYPAPHPNNISTTNTNPPNPSIPAAPEMTQKEKDDPYPLPCRPRLPFYFTCCMKENITYKCGHTAETITSNRCGFAKCQNGLRTFDIRRPEKCESCEARELSNVASLILNDGGEGYLALRERLERAKAMARCFGDEMDAAAELRDLETAKNKVEDRIMKCGHYEPDLTWPKYGQPDFRVCKKCAAIRGRAW